MSNAVEKKKRRGNPDKLKPYQFKPGQSGNPGGRPKKTKLTDATREWLEQVDPKTGKTNAQLAVEAMGEKLLLGSAPHYTAMADRTEGKPAQAITIGGGLELDAESIDVRIRNITERVRARISDAGRKT